MATANKVLNIEPISLGNAVVNLLNCAITSVAGPVGMAATQPYLIIKRIRASNNDASPHTVTLYKGATGGSASGTEVCKALAIAANTVQDIFYGQLRMDAADFLTGLADTASKVTLLVDADISFS